MDKFCILLMVLMGCSRARGGAALPVHYVIRYGPDPLALAHAVETREASVTLGSLSPGLTYYVTVQAVRADGAMSEPSALLRYQVPTGAMKVTLQESDDNTEWTDLATHYRPKHARKFYRLKIEP